ncbi:MAG: bis(5'-nucleosyl)-tetraphosphatase (symmetrical) [Glaciecola sp.]|jgi:bis(5'-nucleosyl)-tetraphosphatase (symmetrical)|uniref:symmetrical bis(5'-nucleosyl)-tetraphosphatase n=1 Tax=Congregibacter sp. TaxID=2744308 RepID=UPI0039E70CBB
MATWVVGDIQGCKQPLKRLLKKVGFSWDRDMLWCTGDLINRGPNCLKTLRFFYKHRDNIRIVLGNHDLHLMAIAAGAKQLGRHDTLEPILLAEDRDELIGWLHQQPLLYQEHGFALVHAGIPPRWSLKQAAKRAREVEAVLKSPDCTAFFAAMYGNEPSLWSDDLEGMERLRVITNHLTRMRYCYEDGRLDLLSKGPLSNPGGAAAKSKALDAWFNYPNRKAANDKILFGHWASLQGQTSTANAIGLDTGCVWGNSMTFYNLETGERVSEPCHC